MKNLFNSTLMFVCMVAFLMAAAFSKSSFANTSHEFAVNCMAELGAATVVDKIIVRNYLFNNPRDREQVNLLKMRVAGYQAAHLIYQSLKDNWSADENNFIRLKIKDIIDKNYEGRGGEQFLQNSKIRTRTCLNHLGSKRVEDTFNRILSDERLMQMLPDYMKINF